MNELFFFHSIQYLYKRNFALHHPETQTFKINGHHHHHHHDHRSHCRNHNSSIITTVDVDEYIMKIRSQLCVCDYYNDYDVVVDNK